MDRNAERQVDLVVVGGGVSGLAAAWTAGAAGTETVLLESAARFGGSVSTHRDGDYCVEGGPHTLLVNDEELETFLRDAGLWEPAIESRSAAAKRFVVRGGRPVALPSSLGSFLANPFLSIPGKVRMLLEPFYHGKKPEGEEPIGPWVGRHFGREVREGLADPFISGIYAGDPDRISLQAAFPLLAGIAELHPSLFRAFLRQRKRNKESGKKRYPRRMMSFPDGLGQMIGHLVRKGRFDALSGVRVQSIERETGGWRVRYRVGSEDDGRTLRCTALLVAVPPSALAEMPFGKEIRKELAGFSAVESPPVTTLSVAFKRTEVQHALDGFGMLCPARERRDVLGILFDSALFPRRAPEDEVLLSAFLGGMRAPEIARCDTGKALNLVKKECRALLGATGEPTYWKSTFWPRAIPQYNLGYSEIADRLDRLEEENEGLAFAGNSRDGVALGACILSGVRRARELLKRQA